MIKALPAGKEIPPEFKESPEKCAIYELSATILQIQADEDLPHLVAQIKGLLKKKKEKEKTYADTVNSA